MPLKTNLYHVILAGRRAVPWRCRSAWDLLSGHGQGISMPCRLTLSTASRFYFHSSTSPYNLLFICLVSFLLCTYFKLFLTPPEFFYIHTEASWLVHFFIKSFQAFLISWVAVVLIAVWLCQICTVSLLVAFLSPRDHFWLISMRYTGNHLSRRTISSPNKLPYLIRTICWDSSTYDYCCSICLPTSLEAK